MDPSLNYKLPKDPWVIHVRWKADNLGPPRSSHPSAASLGRQSNTDHSTNSPIDADGFADEVDDVSLPPKGSSPNIPCLTTVYTHMTIQLYEMEKGVYLVDFKLDGYENADGLLLEDKEVTSPFPFLDQASDLILALAESD